MQSHQDGIDLCNTSLPCLVLQRHVVSHTTMSAGAQAHPAGGPCGRHAAWLNVAAAGRVNLVEELQTALDAKEELMSMVSLPAALHMPAPWSGAMACVHSSQNVGITPTDIYIPARD